MHSQAALLPVTGEENGVHQLRKATVWGRNSFVGPQNLISVSGLEGFRIAPPLFGETDV